MVVSLRLATEAKNIFGKPGLSIRDAVGELVDVRFAAGGDVSTIVVSTAKGERELAPGPGLAVGNHLLRPAV